MLTDMKVTLNSKPPERKLVAIIAIHDCGLFVRSEGAHAVYINSEGVAQSTFGSLEHILLQDADRTAVYEGDNITLQF